MLIGFVQGYEELKWGTSKLNPLYNGPLVSFCHLVPTQDIKWHKVPLSGEDTKWHNVCHLVSFVGYSHFPFHIQKKKFLIFMFMRTHISFWNIIRDNCGFHGIYA